MMNTIVTKTRGAAKIDTRAVAAAGAGAAAASQVVDLVSAAVLEISQQQNASANSVVDVKKAAAAFASAVAAASPAARANLAAEVPSDKYDDDADIHNHAQKKCQICKLSVKDTPDKIYVRTSCDCIYHETCIKKCGCGTSDEDKEMKKVSTVFAGPMLQKTEFETHELDKYWPYIPDPSFSQYPYSPPEMIHNVVVVNTPNADKDKLLRQKLEKHRKVSNTKPRTASKSTAAAAAATEETPSESSDDDNK